MRVIYKYGIGRASGVIRTGANAIVLGVGLDGSNIPCIWIEQDFSEEKYSYAEVYHTTLLTGELFHKNPRDTHVGTFTDAGGFVHHVFTYVAEKI